MTGTVNITNSFSPGTCPICGIATGKHSERQFKTCFKLRLARREERLRQQTDFEVSE